SGVHANEFYCTVKVETNIHNDKIVSAFNFYLPKDIAVYECFDIDESFHPRYNVIYKEYLYLIWNSRQRNPFYEGRMYHVPYLLDTEVMNEAAQYFVGKKDFAAFMAEGSSITDTVREIKYFNVTREDEIIKLTVAADGFLYNMVRILTGTLIYVSEGKIKPDDIEDIISSKNRGRAGFTVPPEGLYLNKVIYNEQN
ncbi:MAG: tRNA pseudouridine synthase A, partial [Oscillospiraceae bacterium]|nr:tRNA pseudouridine synthase A [Oscillospiraceae bacterium]